MWTLTIAPLKASASGADPSTHWDSLLRVDSLRSGSISSIASELLYCLTACFVALAVACMHLLISTLVFPSSVSICVCPLSNVPGVLFSKPLPSCLLRVLRTYSPSCSPLSIVSLEHRGEDGKECVRVSLDSRIGVTNNCRTEDELDSCRVRAFTNLSELSLAQQEEEQSAVILGP